MLRERLEWGKLATFVPNKKTPVYNWFYYKEGFARELVLECIRMFGLQPGQTVLDPFSGVGTTLLACKEKGIDSVGFDVLPASVFASRVKTGKYNPDQLRESIAWLFQERFKPTPMEFPERFKRFFSKPLRDDIAFFKARIDQLEPRPVREFILLGFINTAMKASWVWKDGGVLKVRKHPVPPFRKFFQRVLKRMVKEWERFQGTGTVSVDFGDARKLRLGPDTIDGVITSPPYLNQIDYTKVYEIENWFVGQPRPAIRSYLGLGEESPLDTYLRDMEQVLRELFRVCRPGAGVGLVVGDALVEGRPVEIDLKLAELAQGIGFTPGDILVLNKRAALRARTIKVGLLRESLIVLEK
ncbi:MAG: DNA methyltransferase [Candidatus Aenigmatarchaeota archaeon]